LGEGKPYPVRHHPLCGVKPPLDALSCQGFPQQSKGIPRRKFRHFAAKVEVKSDSWGRSPIVSSVHNRTIRIHATRIPT
jgi:hypothetical protein